MIAISIAITITAVIFGYVALKFFDLLRYKLDREQSINSGASSDALSAAITEQFTAFDNRINNSFAAIGSLKEDLNSIRMQLALKAK